MKIKRSSEKRGKDRLGEQKIGPTGSKSRWKELRRRKKSGQREAKGRPRELRNLRGSARAPIFLGPGPPQSILDTKIPRKNRTEGTERLELRV